MKGVGNIKANKNSRMPPPCFITPTHNAYEALAEYDDDANNEDNNLSTPLLVRVSINQ